MRLELTGRHIDITPSLRRLVDNKLGKLERLLNDSAVSAHAVVTREKYRLLTEITLHARGEKFLHGVGSAGAWEASVDQAIEKLSQQAQKVKGKWQRRKRRPDKGGEPIAIEERETQTVKPAGRPAPGTRLRMPRIFRAERHAIKAMSVGDAARAIDAKGDSIVIFRDTETSALSVLYRRNGELTLVETET